MRLNNWHKRIWMANQHSNVLPFYIKPINFFIFHECSRKTLSAQLSNKEILLIRDLRKKVIEINEFFLAYVMMFYMSHLLKKRV